jgi:diketogulonate reductase-like aldo/keto reductase
MSSIDSAIPPASAPMPPILYGTAWKKDETAALVERALRAGFRGIDTACQPKHYNERGVGDGIQACIGTVITRAELYLQSKFTSVDGHDPQGIPYNPNLPLKAQVAQSLAMSLHNLRSDYLDALVLHSPMREFAQTIEVWQEMERLVDDGGTRRIGISNCYQLATLERLYRAARIKPTIVQNRFYSDTGYDHDIRAFCRAHDITYQSFWTLTANPHLLAHRRLQVLAGKYRRTPAQILFHVLSRSGVVPLTGTRSETHMREDLAIDAFELSEAECAAVSELFRA